MAKLPVVSGKQLAKFFEARGFERKRQRGSHITLGKAGIPRPLVVPNNKEVRVSVVLNNLNTAGISRDEFIKAMQKSKKSASAD